MQVGYWHRWTWLGVLIVMLALVVSVGACAPGATSVLLNRQASPALPQPTLVPLGANPAPLQPTGRLQDDVEAVIQRYRQAVVFVGIIANVESFSQPVPIGNGSGAIIDPQGDIVTNNHVVEGADRLSVTLPDGRTFDAQLVGRDPATDIAVIRIQGNNLPYIPLGDSDQVQVGEFVVAIGNALGLEGGPTVTVGVVSALGRTIETEPGVALSGLIQTDAAINPGNSGGPLMNLRGELIGINTAAPGQTTSGFQPSGIGFAIAINEARPIIDQLLREGRVIRPYLGIVPVTVTPAVRAQLGLSTDRGVIITGVSQGSPAAQAGLEPGDVIIRIDDTPIENTADLRNALGAHKVGDEVQVTIVRGTQQGQVPVRLGESPAPA